MRPTFTLAVLSCGLCWGQAADDCKPSTLNIPGAQYPCVYSDNRVTFRLVVRASPDPTSRVHDMKGEARSSLWFGQAKACPTVRLTGLFAGC